MKKMLLLLRWPCLLQDVLNRRFTFKQTGSSSNSKETITHHFFVSELGRRNCRCSQNLAAQKMLLKQKPSKHS